MPKHYNLPDEWHKNHSTSLNIGDRLIFSSCISPNQYLLSQNGCFKAVLHFDGNFVIYRLSTNSAIWSSNTMSKVSSFCASKSGAVIKFDGFYGIPMFLGNKSMNDTETQEIFSGLIMRDDGNLVTYGDSKAIFETNSITNC
jgi:hypothetical protein